MEIIADKISITGPKVDGGFTIRFDVGEYEQDKIAELLKIPQQVPIKLSVEIQK